MMPTIERSFAQRVAHYQAKSPDGAAAHSLHEFEGDAIAPGARIDKRSDATGLYTEGGQLVGSERDGYVFVDFHSPENIRIPLMFRLQAGTHDSELLDKIEAERERFRYRFSGATEDAQQLELLKKYAATEKNLANASAHLPEERKFSVKQRALKGLKHLRGANIGQAVRGYNCMLEPNQKMARLKRIGQRFKIIGEGAAFTYRNPRIVGEKGTRTFWSNVPAAVVISIVVAAGTLVYLHMQHQKSAPSNREFVTT